MQIAGAFVTIIFNSALLEYGGELAVAVIGIIHRTGTVLVMPIFGISQGVQPIIGYNYGAKNYGRVLHALKLGCYAATAISVAGFLVSEIFAESIIGLFNPNPELIAMGASALRISMAIFPLVGFQIICSAYFQSVGKAAYATFLTMSRQIIILIPAIIFLPKYFDITGIWLAMPLSDLLSTMLTVACLWLELKKH
jgi:Na+-driven multidrug efflux pump